MELFSAKTFISSYANLQDAEQKSVRETVLRFQENPAHPSLSKHRLDRSRDSRFWSLRCSRDVRIIINESEYGTVLCYVDHHDPAYAWAEKRKLELNPTTGVMQIVEIRDLLDRKSTR